MIRRLRNDSRAGTNFEAAQLTISRGMADVLVALDNVIDDDAALGRVYAGIGSAVTTPRANGPASSRHKLAVRSVAAAMIAALAAGASAVALRAVGTPGVDHDGTDGPGDRGSYVVKRVSSALRIAETGEIAQMTVTTDGAGPPGGRTATTISEEWSRGDQWRSVAIWPAGHLSYDEGSSATSLYTLVSYPTRAWARQPGLGRPAAPASDPGSCESVVAAHPLLLQPGLPGSGFSAGSPLTVASDLRAAVSCGTLALAGRQRVDGLEAIQLTSKPDSLISETVWVSPRTYLPVRVVIRPPHTKPEFLTADITWLPITAQNLAELRVPVPSGFRHVRLAKAVTPVLQHAPG
jgi:hypothetical protein